MTATKKPKRPTAKQEARLLAWVNRERAEFGRAPIKRLATGFTRSPETCPIARSLPTGSRCGTVAWLPRGDRPPYMAATFVEWRTMPKFVRQFIWRFDAGWYTGLRKRV